MTAIFHKNMLFRNALLYKIAAHGRRFRDSLVASLPTADDEKRFPFAFSIQLQRKIQALCQNARDLIAVNQRAAMDDDGVKSSLQRENRQEQHIQNEGQQQRRSV